MIILTRDNTKPTDFKTLYDVMYEGLLLAGTNTHLPALDFESEALWRLITKFKAYQFYKYVRLLAKSHDVSFYIDENLRMIVPQEKHYSLFAITKHMIKANEWLFDVHHNDSVSSKLMLKLIRDAYEEDSLILSLMSFREFLKHDRVMENSTLRDVYKEVTLLIASYELARDTLRGKQAIK